MNSERRKKFANGLSRLYLPRYEALCDVLSSDWQPYWGFRSVAEQNSLFERGREKSSVGKWKKIGATVTDAQGGESAHNYGCASDWTIFKDGKPIWLKAEDPLWREYEDACLKVGVRWGGDFQIRTDCYHNELEISVSWKVIKDVLDRQGMEAAMVAVEKSVVK